ncbi:MAG: cytochrome ubiquinol oxidase subunit I, partial [Actinomycetia bacterium]|nr:cytochrome ubiquinol oxidase subunit I [Actinomycetes bacterium]
MKMPLFVWMTLVSQFLLLFAIPVLSVAQLLLLLDRQFDANFFNVGQGADPLLWHHLFWIFGHPEVYLMVLPAFGLASEIIPLFARKPIFGYRFMVYAGITIGLLGWGVWVYHMLVTGVGPLSASAFTVATWFIVIPTGVMIFNWISTMRGTKITLNTPMLFAIGLVIQFTIGGLAGGLSQALSRSDPELTDTYLIVAHFHYVLFGGALFGFMAGFYVYWPKIFGYLLNDRVGKWHFWFMVVGFNLTFGSMHILGLQDMERGIQTYDTAEGFNLWNMAATIGAFILAPATLMILVNALYSYAKWNEAGRPDPGPDPWDGRTLEWSIQSPAPCHNFDASPIVSSVDDFWHRKYAEDETGEIRRIATGEELAQPGNPEGVHVPAPSYWPIVGALGLPLVGYGIIFSMWLVIPGVILVLAGAFGWAFEPTDDLDLGTSGGDDHGHGGNHDADPDSGGVGDELLETVR